MQFFSINKCASLVVGGEVFKDFSIIIYHVVDVMHEIKKKKLLLADKLDKWPSKKKKKKKKKKTKNFFFFTGIIDQLMIIV